MTRMSTGKIRVWTEPTHTGRKAALPRLADRVTAEVVEVDSSALSENLKVFLRKIQATIEDSSVEGSSYSIDEVELTLAVNASGGIELVGKLSAGAQAGIKVKLKKRNQTSP